MSKDRLLQIDSGYYCAGVVLREDRVISSAPILRWMKGWTYNAIKDYCKKKGFTVHE